MGLAAFNRARRAKTEQRHIHVDKEYYQNMTDDELAELAAEKDIDLAKVKSRAQLIKQLLA